MSAIIECMEICIFNVGIQVAPLVLTSILSKEEFVSQTSKVVLAKAKISEVILWHSNPLLATKFWLQNELRRESTKRREVRSQVESLHDKKILIPSKLFDVDYATLKQLVDNAMAKEIPVEHDKPWYSNHKTTLKRLSDNCELCSFLVGTVMVLDPKWVEIVESHNEALFSDHNQPVMTPAMMSTYFLNCGKMRDIAFNLVRSPNICSTA